VVYDLYRHTATNACASGTAVVTNLGGTGYVDTVPANNTDYYYCVRTKDSAQTPNTADSGTSTAAQAIDDTGGGGGATCDTCHGGWPQTSGAHAAHGATTDPQVSATECNPCHGDVSGYTTTHTNGTLDLPFPGDTTGGDASYSDGGTPGVLTDDNCSNVSCHYDNTTPMWEGGTASCTTCHNDGSVSVPGAVNEAWPGAVAATGKHDIHVNNASYVQLAGPLYCENCHGAGADTGTHTGHANGSLNVGGALGAYNSAGPDYTCTISCHNVDVARDWRDGATLVCLDCHDSSANYIGDNGGAYLPASGLHAVAPTVTGEQHYDGFGPG